MKTIKEIKPKKKSDPELFQLLTDKIDKGEYIFLNHAKQRLKDRNIIDLDVLNILEGKKSRKRKRNKGKDKYENSNEDWNYCIEGCNLDGDQIRIIISFTRGLMPIITVIHLN